MALSITSRKVLSSNCWRRVIKGSANSVAKNTRQQLSTSKLVHNNYTSPNAVSNVSSNALAKFHPQPVPASHPHLLKSGEITPLIHHDEYRDRRSRLVEEILQVGDRSKAQILLIPSASKVYMSGKIPFVFRQNSDFFYLTGCLEPECVLVITIKPGNGHFEAALFMPQHDSHVETWEGPKLNLDFCINFLGIQQANYTSHLPSFITSFAREHKFGLQIWKDVSRPFRVLDDVISQMGGSIPTLDLLPVLHHLRVVKSKCEQELMRKSCSIISDAVVDTMKVSKPLVCESQLWAAVEYHSRMSGAQHLAYPPVIAGGSRANTIHYISNNQLVNDGEMVLMDAGCQFHGYTSDLTRCWPVNGKFTSYQKECYEALLDVQLDLIQFARELPTLDGLFQRMCSLLGKNLQEIGFGKTASNCAERAQMAYSFCPHHVSHYLGLDVHDCDRVKRNISLQPGMIITIEPGIYVDLNRSSAPKEFHGLGLRIEDDILITESGVEVLTHCPKTVTEIEIAMR